MISAFASMQARLPTAWMILLGQQGYLSRYFVRLTSSCNNRAGTIWEMPATARVRLSKIRIRSANNGSRRSRATRPPSSSTPGTHRHRPIIRPSSAPSRPCLSRRPSRKGARRTIPTRTPSRTSRTNKIRSRIPRTDPPRIPKILSRDKRTGRRRARIPKRTPNPLRETLRNNSHRRRIRIRTQEPDKGRSPIRRRVLNPRENRASRLERNPERVLRASLRPPGLNRERLRGIVVEKGAKGPKPGNPTRMLDRGN